jgi:hypothetical protein
VGEAAGVWAKVVGKAALRICRLGAGGLGRSGGMADAVVDGERRGQLPPSLFPGSLPSGMMPFLSVVTLGSCAPHRA